MSEMFNWFSHTSLSHGSLKVGCASSASILFLPVEISQLFLKWNMTLLNRLKYSNIPLHYVLECSSFLLTAFVGSSFFILFGNVESSFDIPLSFSVVCENVSRDIDHWRLTSLGMGSRSLDHRHGRVLLLTRMSLLKIGFR